MTPRHAHELEAAGEPRWKARLKDDLLLVTDLASGEERQATAYTVEGNAIRFSMPGENGLRVLAEGAPGYEAFLKVLQKSPHALPAAVEEAGSRPATEKATPGTKA